MESSTRDGPWQIGRRTFRSVVLRLAPVPRGLAARALDATPLLWAKLLYAVDVRAVIVLREEIISVAIGNPWVRFVYQRAGIDPYAA